MIYFSHIFNYFLYAIYTMPIDPSAIQLVFTDFLDLSFGLTSTAVLPQLSVTTPIGDYTLEKSISVETLKRVFYFQTDDAINYDASFTKYFVDISQWTTIATDLNPMSYQISSGAFGSNTSDNLGQHFLRYIASSLFGTYLGVDLFENEDDVYQDLSSNAFTNVYTAVLNKLRKVDKIYGDSTMLDIYGTAGNRWMQDASGSYNICRTLLRQIAASATAKTRFEYLDSTYKRATGEYSVPFINGDTIYYSVIVSPSATQHLVTGLPTAISSKKYVLKINVTA